MLGVPTHLIAEERLEGISIFSSPSQVQEAPGSAHQVDKRSLEEFRYTDIHRVLENVPGVYVREEDGYGLRPNIGMRGATSNRSSKVALMEDGILFAPAPYAAPAAYYFPMLSRMQAIEVFKGPVAIQYGPNSVGGAINLVSRSIPDIDDLNGMLDLSIGTDEQHNAHAYYGETSERFGWLVEGLHAETAGFKTLPDGQDTGFDKNEVVVKTRFNTDPDGEVYHQFDLALGYADEISNETYLGLADADFKQDPYQRYAASANDRMKWDHQQFRLSHYVDFGTETTLTTTLYRNDFYRNWGKLNGFAGKSFEEILSNPDQGSNQVYYAILKGEENSATADETLIYGRNKRTYYAQGLQVVANRYGEIGAKNHDLKVGVRLHQDQIKRNHTEEGLLMQNGQLVADGRGEKPATTNTGKADAIALFAHDQVSVGPVILTGGMRFESIDTELLNRKTAEKTTDSHQVTLFGFGFNWRMAPNWRLIGGVHEGFVPVTPGSADNVKPEASVNYELGARFANAHVSAEVIGFFNDYSNLKGTCTFSSGCASNNLDADFNAGEVDVWGIEALFETDLSPTSSVYRLPFKVVYTYSDSEFQNSFTSDNPEFGEVKEGYQLPYMPEHQIAVKMGAQTNDWNAHMSLRYVDKMRNRAGEGSLTNTDSTEAQTYVDLVGNYRLNGQSSIYAKVDNVFDDAYIVSRRPYGARPGKARTLQVGYRLDF